MPEREVEVLVVEDNAHEMEMTVYALEQHHLSNRIHVVRDGAEALEFIFGSGPGTVAPLEAAPRLILLDLKLPKVDGIEVLRRLKADPRTRAIPVVVLTSSSEERDLVESYHLGVNSYLVKPVDFARFTEAVREVGSYWLLLNRQPGDEVASAPVPLRVLLLEDRPADAEMVLEELRRAGFEPAGPRVDTEAAYLAHLGPGLDVILADYALPQFDAGRALALLQGTRASIARRRNGPRSSSTRTRTSRGPGRSSRRRRRWTASGGSPAGSRTTSTTS